MCVYVSSRGVSMCVYVSSLCLYAACRGKACRGVSMCVYVSMQLVEACVCLYAAGRGRQVLHVEAGRCCM